MGIEIASLVISKETFTALSTALAVGIVIQNRPSFNRWQCRGITGRSEFRTWRVNDLSSCSFWKTDGYLDWIIWELRVSCLKYQESREKTSYYSLELAPAHCETLHKCSIYDVSLFYRNISTYLVLEGSSTPFLVLKSMTPERIYHGISSSKPDASFSRRFQMVLTQEQNFITLRMRSSLMLYRAWFDTVLGEVGFEPERLRSMEERTSLMSLAHFGLVTFRNTCAILEEVPDERISKEHFVYWMMRLKTPLHCRHDFAG